MSYKRGGWEGLRQTGEEEREADVLSDHLLVRLWDSQWGTSALRVSRAVSILRQWPSVSWAVKHPWEEEKYSTYRLTFYLHHISCWIVLKNQRWPWHSFSLFTWLQFKIWIAVYAGRLNTQSTVFELKLYCSLMEMPVSSVSSLL